MLKKLSLLGIIAVAFSFKSCNTEFNLNGDYEIQPIVFGLLDHTQSVHMIKITKAFLGEGDNLVYAQNPDSNYFAQVDAKIIEYKDEVETGREWLLFDTIIPNKETGTFYGPEQKVYAFYEASLDSSASYEIRIDVEGNTDPDKTIYARTELLDKFKVSGQLLFPAYKVVFAPNNVDDIDDYTYWTFTTTEALHAARYTYQYTFNWTETYEDLTTASFSATRNDGDYLQFKPSSPSIHIPTFSGLDFFEWLPTAIPVDDNVTMRRMDGIDLNISVAHEDLNQYMEVGEPVSGIAQVQPEFTNFVNARGLFSSRIIYDLEGFRFNSNTMQELCTGQFTNVLNFCSQYIEDSGESWYCP